jgi:hypothetical protein
MSVFGKLWDLVFGTNGFDMDKHDDTVRRIKDESVMCMDKTQMNFEEAKTAFGGLDIEPAPAPEPESGSSEEPAFFEEEDRS